MSPGSGDIRICRTAGLPSETQAMSNDPLIRPFRIHIPQAGLVDLRDWLARTRWAGEPATLPAQVFLSSNTCSKLSPLETGRS
jgi:hypothetical protein